MVGGSTTGLRPGSSVLVKFPQPHHEIWQEVVVLRHLGTEDYYVVTPESDLCRVQLRCPPLTDLRPLMRVIFQLT
jgi:hypothetical protein